jgi:hypothetical protein
MAEYNEVRMALVLFVRVDGRVGGALNNSITCRVQVNGVFRRLTRMFVGPNGEMSQLCTREDAQTRPPPGSPAPKKKKKSKKKVKL